MGTPPDGVVDSAPAVLSRASGGPRGISGVVALQREQTDYPSDWSKRMPKRILLIVIALSLSACTGMYRAITDDPVRVEFIDQRQRDDVEPSAATVSLTAERRTVIVNTLGKTAGRFCAEPPPDVASDLLSALGASIENHAAKGSLNSVYSESAVKLADRSTALDIYRTGTYVLCQYHLNGGMTDTQLNANFELLTKQVINALIESYKQPKQVVVDGSRLFTVIPTLDVRATTGGLSLVGSTNSQGTTSATPAQNTGNSAAPATPTPVPPNTSSQQD